MTDNFPAAVAVVLAQEGGLSIDNRDAGGVTRYGISAASYPHLDIVNLTREAAEAIYRADFWAPLRCAELPWPVAVVLFAAGVNQGIGTAAQLLQRALGVKVDGQLGPTTMAVAAREEPILLAGLLSAEITLRYANTAGLGTFGRGWMRRAFVMHRAALAGPAQA